MKRRNLLSMLLLAFTLVVGGSLLACSDDTAKEEDPGTTDPNPTDEDPTWNPVDDETTYNITVNADEGVNAYRLMNLTVGTAQPITSAPAGDEIILTGIGTITNYNLVSVTSTQVTLQEETASYSFIMPNEDVVINITTEYVRSPDFYFMFYSSSYTYVDIVAYSGEVFERNDINPADYDVTDLLGGTNFYSGDNLGISLTIKEEYADTYSTISFTINDVTPHLSEYTFTYIEDSVQTQTTLNLYKVILDPSYWGQSDLYGWVSVR